MKNQIIAVLFDFDDTLYPFKKCEDKTIKVVYEQLSRRIKKRKVENIRAFEDLYKETRDRVNDELCMGFLKYKKSNPPIKVSGARLIQAGSHNRTIIFKRMLKEVLGKEDSLLRVRFSHDLGKLYETLFVQHMIDSYNPMITELLDELRTNKNGKQKFKLGLVTNYTLSSQLRKLRKLGIEDRFDTIVTSEEAGADKPGKGIFLRELEELGVVNPKSAVMVGDNDTDIAGANNLGIWTIRFKQSEKIKDCREQRKEQHSRVAKKRSGRDNQSDMKQKTIDEKIICSDKKFVPSSSGIDNLRWKRLVQANAVVCNLKELKQLLAELVRLSPESAFSNFRSQYWINLTLKLPI